MLASTALTVSQRLGVPDFAPVSPKLTCRQLAASVAAWQMRKGSPPHPSSAQVEGFSRGMDLTPNHAEDVDGRLDVAHRKNCSGMEYVARVDFEIDPGRQAGA
mmetsp:Transcript_52260/g.86688  ORF Transcript_52260/g.86688 Transcript_52260/m.86688 type:complete len:103 (-) Transcript_52260:1487-1795(-)